MKTISVDKFKSHFPDVVDQVKARASFAVTYGRKEEIVGNFLPDSQIAKLKRKLGLLEG